MNYLYLIALIVILYFIWDKTGQVFDQTPTIDDVDNVVYSNHTGSTKQENTTNIGFVKPEHRLIKILTSISSGTKIILAGKCDQFIYNKNTITTELKDKLTYLVHDVISSLNHISQNEYYMKTIENVYAIIDSKGNQRYIMDFFIYDTKHYYTIRLIADIVIVDHEIYINYLHVQSGSNNRLLNKYDIKFNSVGILFDSNMFQQDITKIFDSYYTTSFKVIGVSDSSLEYNKEDLTGAFTMNSLRNAYLPPTISSDTYEELSGKGLSGYLDMYLPENQNLIKSPEFCNKYKMEWDKYGVPNNNDSQDGNCYLNNTQTTTKINDPWFGPGVMYKRSSQDQYKWLKDPAFQNIYRAQGYHI